MPESGLFSDWIGNNSDDCLGVFPTSSPGSSRFPEDPGDEVGSVPCLHGAVSRGNVTPTAI